MTKVTLGISALVGFAALGGLIASANDLVSSRTIAETTSPIAPYDEIDQYFTNEAHASWTQLNKRRSVDTHFCPSVKGLLPEKSFAGAIDLALSYMWKDRYPLEPALRKDSFKAVKNDGSVPVSFLSHKLCGVSEKSLDAMGFKHLPGPKTISRMNDFAHDVNDAWVAARRDRSAANAGALKTLKGKWGRLLGCLAYEESLSTADLGSSDRAAERLGLRKRPEGVLVYYDPAQSKASKWNLGLFQFTPNPKGNIRSCMLSWNRTFPSCPVNMKQSAKEFMQSGHLTESDQFFNAYCGADKILETFDVQVNTSDPRKTHRMNWIKDGKKVTLKEPKDRCVTPFSTSLRTYNHFGPLQNTTGDNLAELMSCIQHSAE